MVIGTDLDNTLIAYDGLFSRVAAERGWIEGGPHWSKRAVRDALRRQSDGELQWQRLQAQVYGRDIHGASLFEGVRDFLARCRSHGVTVFVVSHKTQFAAAGEYADDLRQHALSWMDRQGFFSPEGLGFARKDIFFEPSRTAKLARIGALGCTHFIDDMEETFTDPAFPPGVERLLFDPWREGINTAGMRAFHTWAAIAEDFFGPCNEHP